MSTDRPRRGENDAEEDLGDDRVRDDDFERDFGEGEPPDPLGQAEPAVTEAHIAEAGPDGPQRQRRRPRAERAARAEAAAAAGRAGNEIQQSAAVPNGEAHAPDEEEHHEHHGHSHETVHRKGIFGRAADFMRASYAELRRVQWPDRRQVGQGTAVTLGFVIVAGAYLGLLDAIWNPIIQAIL